MGRGISAFSFHPKYKENGYVFVFSHADAGQDASSKKSRISRYQTRAWQATRPACAPDRKPSSWSGLPAGTTAERRSSDPTDTLCLDRGRDHWIR